MRDLIHADSIADAQLKGAFMARTCARQA
jgi:hypothetical protein